MLQTALGCAMRKSKAASGPSYAQIPRILALASINAEDTNEDGTTEFSSSNMIAMERLEGTLLNLLESLDTKQQQIHVLKEALRQVAKTLSYLSSRFDFEHLDLHAENVMYKKNGSKYQFYIIDFGLSRARINGVLFSSPVRGLARQTYPEGDIGMLVSYMFSRQLPVPPFLRGAMDVLVKRIEDNRTAYDRYIRGEIQRRKHKFEPMPFHQLHWNLYEQRRYLLDELQPFRPAAILAELAPKEEEVAAEEGGQRRSRPRRRRGARRSENLQLDLRLSLSGARHVQVATVVEKDEEDLTDRHVDVGKETQQTTNDPGKLQGSEVENLGTERARTR